MNQLSEKRFELAYEQGNWWAVRDGNITLWKEEVVDLLNEQQATITELKSIINFASNEGDLIVLLMKEIIKLRQEVQECRAYETIEKGVSNYD